LGWTVRSIHADVGAAVVRFDYVGGRGLPGGLEVYFAEPVRNWLCARRVDAPQNLQVVALAWEAAASAFTQRVPLLAQSDTQLDRSCSSISTVWVSTIETLVHAAFRWYPRRRRPIAARPS
jgi:hypothetical protein